MRNGLSAGPLPSGLIYATPIEAGCLSVQSSFSPLVAYAVAFRESVRGQLQGQWPSAASVMSQNGDGGHGLFQITPQAWWTKEMLRDWASIKWEDPASNCGFAVKWFLLDAEAYWSGIGLRGDGLIKCIADEFNAGRTAVIRAHALGNADLASTGKDYGSDVLANYHLLLSGQHPK